MTALMRDVDDATAAEVDQIVADAVTADVANGAATADTPAQAQTQPLITVIKGAPSDIELAALVAVLTAASVAGGPTPAGPVAEENWGHPTFMHQSAVAFSPGTFSTNPQLRQ